MENSTIMETTDENEYIRDMFNYSYSDYYDYFINKEINTEYRHVEFQIIDIILITVIVLSFIGNILVVVISACCMRLRSLTSIFKLNLALSDLLFTVGMVFSFFAYKLEMSFDIRCKVGSVILPAGFYSSILFLVLMSFQRYIIVVHPHTGWKKGRRFTVGLICAWIVSILAALPATAVCTHKISLLVPIYLENIIFVSAFLFVGFCYIRILQTIFKSTTNQRHKTTGLAFLLVVTFFICWAPFSIVIFMFTLPYDLAWFFYHPYTFLICYLLAFTRCCLNPVIYGLFGLKFRMTEREIFQRRANLNSAQMSTEEHHSDGFVDVNI